MGIISSHEAICSECHHSTGQFGSMKGVTKRVKADNWKMGIVKTLCPECNPDNDREFAEVQCTECQCDGKRLVGVECPFGGCSGVLEKV